jgi:parallel beta-helix repeat protein
MDKYLRLRKCVVFGIILLFVGTCLIPVTAQNTEKPSFPTSSDHWLYVGGSGPGNYSVIQDAIDNASDGDTVYIYRGIYSDYLPEYSTGVFIDKDITLIGENKYSTVINGSIGWRSVVNIMTAGVCINGFTIQNCEGGIAAVLIENYTSLNSIKDITIYDTIIRENVVGISSFSNLSNCMFYNNNISNNDYGIELIHCTNCSVYNNHISNNMYGIVLESVESNVIEYNLILKNEIGIETRTSHGTIVCNNFINNKQHADFINWFSNILFLIIPLLLYYKQYWNNNYWDDWTTTNPRPIQGQWMVIYAIGDFHFLFGPFPSLQFDWHPAQEPYDIPSTALF